MSEYISCYQPSKGDIIDVSTKVIIAPKNIKIGQFVNLDNDTAELKIIDNNTEDTIGIVKEHIVEKYKFKEVWNLFIKFILRKDKINCVRVEIIK